MSLLTIYAVEHNVVVYSHASILGYRTKLGTMVQMNLYYTLKLFLQLGDIDLGS